MANEFKIKKGLIVTGASGGTVVDIQGSQGQLFSVTDDLSGSIFAVSDISGVPILDVNSSGLSTFAGTVASPTFLGDLNGTINTATTGVTQTAGNNSTLVATTAYADAAASAVPIGNYLPLAGGRMTTTAKIEFYNATQYIHANSTNDLTLASGDDINFKSNYNRFYNGTTEYARLSGSNNSWLANGSGGKIGISTTTPVETLTVPGGEGVMLGFKRFYSDTGQVPAGIGSAYALTANLNTEQGTTLTSKYQYKFYLTTTGTGTYNSSVYIVYRNSADTAWDVHRVSSTGLSSNHPELTLSSTSALIYNDHPSSYNVSYRVETSYTGQSKTSPQIFGSDYMWTRDNTDLYYMDGDVGIGTASPFDSRLEVAGKIRAAGGTSGGYFFGSEEFDGGFYAPSDGNLAFATNNAERIRIDGNGNLGINETNPGVKLQVITPDEQVTNFSSSVVDQLIYSQISSNSSTAGVITGAAALELVGKANASGHGRHAWIGAEGTPNTSLKTKLKFKVRGETATGYDWAGAAEAPTIMTLEGDGNVGIGTTSPSSTLTLGNASDNVAELRVLRSNGSSSTYASVNTIGGTSQFGSSGATRVYSTGNESLNLRTNGSDRLTILSSGNVGIGNTSPQSLLHVGNGSGVILSAGLSTWADNTVLSNGWTSGVGDWLKIEVPSADDENGFIQLNSNGNVGIGTGSPGYKLTVEGAIAVQDAQNLWLRGGRVGFENTALNNAAYIYNIGASGSSKLNIADTLYVVEAGNVGIGVTGPGEKLTIGDTGNVGMSITDGTHTQYVASIATANAYGNGSTAGQLYLRGYDGIGFSGNQGGATHMTLLTGGNVGIGTTTPSAKLDVQGTQGQLFSVTDDLSGDIFSVADISGVPILNVNSSGLVTVDGTSYFNGNVGIGTNSPGAKLEVEGDATGDDTPQLIVASGGADNNAIIHFTDDDGGQVNAIGALEGNMLTFASQNEMIFKVGTSSILGNTDTKMTIATSGKVGIGTTVPSAMLHVDNPQTSSSSIGVLLDPAAGGYSTIGMKVNIADYGEGMRFVRSGTYSGNGIKFFSNTSQVGAIFINQFSTSYNTTSDYRTKENVVPMENSINRLKELKPCRFNFIISPENTVDGFMAHEAQEVVPEAVTGEKDKLDFEGNPEYQGIDQAKLVPLLTSALQEAINKIEQLETRIQTLENN
jgi:hypothetical protein